MIPNKLYFNTALKVLENENYYLVRFFPWGGLVRSKDGKEQGDISTRVMEKLMDSGKLEYIGKGRELLDHETYYKLKKYSSEK